MASHLLCLPVYGLPPFSVCHGGDGWCIMQTYACYTVSKSTAYKTKLYIFVICEVWETDGKTKEWETLFRQV